MPGGRASNTFCITASPRSSAIPDQSDRCMGPARTEAAAVVASTGKSRIAEIVLPAVIPVSWSVIWCVADCSLRTVNGNVVVGRLMIAGQEAVAMPGVDDQGLSVHGRGECNGGGRE